MLSPFDDYPIHPSADPIAHPATGDPNHYDRYWFNGTRRPGSSTSARPWATTRSAGSSTRLSVWCGRCRALHLRLRRDAARPFHQRRPDPHRGDRADPHHPIRGRAQRTRHQCDLTFRATTVAIEEPRQTRRRPEGILTHRPHPPHPVGYLGGHGRRRRRRAAHRPRRGVGHPRPIWGVRPVGKQLQISVGMRCRRPSGSGRRCISKTASLTWLCMSTRTAAAGSRARSSSTRSRRRIARGARPASASATTSSTSSSGSLVGERSTRRLLVS